MKPAICYLCNKSLASDIDGKGDHVEFLDYEYTQGTDGHPSGWEWFCSEHIDAAMELKHYSAADAFIILRRLFMDQNNPYQSPQPPVTKPDTKSLGTWRICALTFIVLQTGLYAMNATTLLEATRNGSMNVIALLLSLLASFFLVFGGVMLFFKSRSANYLLGTSVLASILVLVQSATPLAITALGIAFVATLISIRTSKL